MKHTIMNLFTHQLEAVATSMDNLSSESRASLYHWSSPPLAVTATIDSALPEAMRLAAFLNVPFFTFGQPSPPLLLIHTGKRLELHDTTCADGPVFADFLTGKAGFRRRHSGKKQPLARAVGLSYNKNIRVLDATPGLGRDAFVLASLGCRVQMVERSAVVAALLHDGLERAVADAEVAAIVRDRLQLTVGNALTFMGSSDKKNAPDVVYLDPMYPHHDKSALVKKEMRRLRALVGKDADAPALLTMALTYAGKRVVVKRPRLAPPLADKKADWSISGKSTRFDIYTRS